LQEAPAVRIEATQGFVVPTPTTPGRRRNEAQAFASHVRKFKEKPLLQLWQSTPDTEHRAAEVVPVELVGIPLGQVQTFAAHEAALHEPLVQTTLEGDTDGEKPETHSKGTATPLAVLAPTDTLMLGVVKAVTHGEFTHDCGPAAAGPVREKPPKHAEQSTPAVAHRVAADVPVALVGVPLGQVHTFAEQPAKADHTPLLQVDWRFEAPLKPAAHETLTVDK